MIIYRYPGPETTPMTEQLITDKEFEELLGAMPDPYPELPLMQPDELRDGDVLMMFSTARTQIGPVKLPVSWLIRYLDGGAYSHSAVVTIKDGVPKVWDHSAGWVLHPVPLDHGIADHEWCHVYRLDKHDETVGSRRYPAHPLVHVLGLREGDPYDIYRLVFSGIITVLSARPSDPRMRDLARRALIMLTRILTELWEQKKFDDRMLVCTAVAGLSYWTADNGTPHDYALEANLERRRRQHAAAADGDADWDEAVAAMRDLLNKVYGDFDAQVQRHQRELWGGNADWVEIGSAALPATLVSPSDLEFSRTLRRVGHLAIPPSPK
jgi:hypothetical protein